MSTTENKCKIAYAADGTTICDPKTRPNIQGSYVSKPSCAQTNCTVFGKTCIPNKKLKE